MNFNRRFQIANGLCLQHWLRMHLEIRESLKHLCKRMLLFWFFGSEKAAALFQCLNGRIEAAGIVQDLSLVVKYARTGGGRCAVVVGRR